MKSTGPIYVIRKSRRDESLGSAYWTGKGWSDRHSAHDYRSEVLAQRQWMRLVKRFDTMHVADDEVLHLDRHPSTTEFLRDPVGTRTTRASTLVGAMTPK